MEFKIARASNWGYFATEEKPIRDKRIYSKIIPKWENVDDEMVKRWFIQINTLEELMELREQVNSDLIIGEAYEDKNITEILIYDDYIE